MKKITNIKTNENKKNLLKESGFKNIQEAKKGLNMKNEKAQLVYQALLETYNQQYDEMKKNQKKTKSKENYDIQKDVKQVKAFNKNDKALTIKNITPKKLKAIIKNIDTTKRTVLTIGNLNYTLTPEKQANLLQNEEIFFIKEDAVNQGTHSSDAEMTYEVIKLKTVEMSRPKWKGKNILEGAFFKYYHNTSFDLDEFGVHSEKQEKYNENCFVQALISSGVDSIIINDVSFLKSRKKLICI